MVHPLLIEPEAELDLEHAFEWYESQRTGLGREFLQSIEDVFNRLREMPESSAVVHGKARLTLARRFPYVVCYLFEGETVYVLAVFHGHRDPESWQERVL